MGEGQIQIVVDRDVAAHVLQQIQFFWDEGPRDEGWQSVQLETFIAALEEALSE